MGALTDRRRGHRRWISFRFIFVNGVRNAKIFTQQMTNCKPTTSSFLSSHPFNKQTSYSTAHRNRTRIAYRKRTASRISNSNSNNSSNSNSSSSSSNSSNSSSSNSSNSSKQTQSFYPTPRVFSVCLEEGGKRRRGSSNNISCGASSFFCKFGFLGNGSI